MSNFAAIDLIIRSAKLEARHTLWDPLEISGPGLNQWSNQGEGLRHLIQDSRLQAQQPGSWEIKFTPKVEFMKLSWMVQS